MFQHYVLFDVYLHALYELQIIDNIYGIYLKKDKCVA